MKKILLYIVIPIIFILISSCSDFLDIKPEGKAIPETTEDFASLLHNQLNVLDLGKENYIVGTAYSFNDWDGACGDDFECSLSGTEGKSLKAYIGDIVGSTKAYTPYKSNYEVIRDCNIVIEGIKDKAGKEADEVRATAYALRAVAYYQLMRIYCDAPDFDKLDKQLGLPLVSEFDLEAHPKRSNLKDLILFIESDLKNAINLKNQNTLYRFTEDVCKGYLARLYFWTENWNNALALSHELLDKYPLIEGDAYKEMFNTKLGDLKGNQLLKTYRIVTSETSLIYARQNIKERPVSLRYIKLFNEDDKDIRDTTWFDKKLYIQKDYFCGMRAAEFKLIEAECLYHLGREGEALVSLNDFRRKRISDYKYLTIADLPDKSPNEIIIVDATGKNLTPTIAYILRERRKEFILEGDRFFEQKRNGKPSFTTIYKDQVFTTLAYMYTYPLPDIDVKLSDLKQNEGYTDFITQ